MMMAKSEMVKMALAEETLVRKQLMFTPEQARFLKDEAERTGRSEADIAREALQNYMDENSEERRIADLLAIVGIWENHTGEEMAELQEIRESANRLLGEELNNERAPAPEGNP
jgi:hypothetical protein